MPTMAEVAALAGVTKMTVSRVLRRPEKVTPDTRARVAEAMAALGYVPNLLAGSLTAGTSGLVAAIVPTLRHSLFADTLEGLSAVLEAAGLGLFVSASGYRTDLEETLDPLHRKGVPTPWCLPGSRTPPLRAACFGTSAFRLWRPGRRRTSRSTCRSAIRTGRRLSP